MVESAARFATNPSPGAESTGRSADALLPKLQETLDRVERELIVDALRLCRGNKAKAARELGISERIMGLRVRKYGIDAKSFRRIL